MAVTSEPQSLYGEDPVSMARAVRNLSRKLEETITLANSNESSGAARIPGVGLQLFNSSNKLTLNLNATLGGDSGVQLDLATAAVGDFIAIYDVDASSHKRVTAQTILDLAAGVVDGTVTTTGLAANGAVLEIALNSLTTDGTPDLAADFVMTYDTNAAGLKKILLNKMSGYVSGAGGNLDVNGTLVMDSNLDVGTDGGAGDTIIKINGTQVVKARQSHITHATENHNVSGGDTVSASGVKGDLDDLGEDINNIITVLENHGLIATV